MFVGCCNLIVVPQSNLKNKILVIDFVADTLDTVVNPDRLEPFAVFTNEAINKNPEFVLPHSIPVLPVQTSSFSPSLLPQIPGSLLSLPPLPSHRVNPMPYFPIYSNLAQPSTRARYDSMYPIIPLSYIPLSLYPSIPLYLYT